MALLHGLGMGYPFEVAFRYLGSKKRASVSVGTAFAILGVALGVAALATVMSVTSGFQAQFREKVLGVNAHVLVLKYSTDFREYRTVMEQVSKVPGVEGTAPFIVSPMMLTHGDATETAVAVKGVDPARSLGIGAPPGEKPVLLLPRQIVGCEEAAKQGVAAAMACGQEKLQGLRLPDARPAERRVSDGQGATFDDSTPADAGSPVEADPDPPAAGKGPRGAVAPDGGYKSVLPDDDLLPTDIDPDPCASPAKVSQLPGIVVGAALATKLHLAIGDCVTVSSPTIGYSFSGDTIKPPVARRYRLLATFQAGFEQYDAKWAYVDLYEAQTFLDQGDTVIGIEMILGDIEQAPRVSRQISDMLGSGLYHTMDWEELNHGLFTALRIQQIGMSVVLALIIIVAAFTVVATLIMVVLEKKREISVMKAMGATDGAILRIFLYQGGIIGLAGAVLGLLLGLLVCKGLLAYGFPLDPKVYFISRLPVQVRPLEFLITGEVALAICLEATVLPSLYAANLSPVDGFRNEASEETEGWPVPWYLVAAIPANLLAAIGAAIQTSYDMGPLVPWIILGARVALAALTAVALRIRWRSLMEGGTQRRMPWAVSAWLLALHVAGVAVLLAVVVALESDGLSAPESLGLAVAGLGCAIVALCSLGLRLWKRWGFYGLFAMHLVALPLLWRLGTRVGTVPLTLTLTSLVLITVGIRRYWRLLDG